MAADQAFGFACRFEIAQASKSLKLTSLRRLPQLNACKAKSQERLAQRNGYRDRSWETCRHCRAAHPRAAQRLLLPGLSRAAADGALTAVVQDPYVQGVSTRSVDDLAQVMA
jgi:transposase-like protein